MSGGGVRIVVAGGGTGGHFFPGLAVAQALLRQRPDAEVRFVGGRSGIEARLAPKYGFPLLALSLSGFAGMGLGKRLIALLQLPAAVVRCADLCLRWRPKAVLGVGGYASLPMGLAALLTGTPLGLLEQNVAPGLANRILGRMAAFVAVAFPQTLANFPGRGRLTGNPVRQGMTALSEPAAQAPLRLLVFGGSRGARAINDAIIAALPALKDFPGGLELLHQTGLEDLARVEAAYGKSGAAVRVEPFIEEMGQAYAQNHAVVCRAGATTCAELAAARKPALLIPFPHSAGNHQEANAKGMAELGAARWIRQSDLTTEALLEHLRSLADPMTRGDMKSALGKLARPTAADEIASLLLCGARP